jgi:hypothetical protein
MEIDPELNAEIEDIRSKLQGIIERKRFARLTMANGDVIDFCPLEVKTVPSETLGTMDVVEGVLLINPGGGRWQSYPLFFFESVSEYSPSDEQDEQPSVAP